MLDDFAGHSTTIEYSVRAEKSKTNEERLKRWRNLATLKRVERDFDRVNETSWWWGMICSTSE